MAKLKHRLEYLLAKVIIAISRSLDDEKADKFGSILGKLYGKLIPSRRKIAIDNLNLALDIIIPANELNPLVDRIFENIGRTFVEQARLTKAASMRLKNIIAYNGIDYVTDTLQKGRGGVVVTAHFGNWEMQAAYTTECGYPLDVIAKVQHNPLFDRLINDIREQMNVNVIPVRSSTLRDVFKSLKENRLVGIVADQHDPSQNLIMNFLGRPASVAKGPAVFAMKQKCPILPILMRRVKYDQHILISHPPIYPNESGDDEQDIIDMTRKYLNFFEEMIKKYPDQWMWTHRRWKV